MTDSLKERMQELSALHEVEGTAFRGYLDKLLAQTDKRLRRPPNDEESHRLQGRAQLLEELISDIDGASEEMIRLKLNAIKPDMSKAF